MISNLLINQQKFTLFVDNVGMERFSDQLIQALLKQQGQNSVQSIPANPIYHLDKVLCDITDEPLDLPVKTNIVLQPLAKLLTVYTPKSIFQLVNKLKKNSNVQQVFLWATTKNIAEHFVVPFLEHLSDQIVTLLDRNHLTIIIRKTGGVVTNKYYQYQLGNEDFTVREVKKSVQKPAEPEPKPEASFKIDLEEEEMVARNALKLPYERTTDADVGQILYTPDVDDDFDEEDPDDDLCI